jgi:hypothetical protein
MLSISKLNEELMSTLDKCEIDFNNSEKTSPLMRYLYLLVTYNHNSNALLGTSEKFHLLTEPMQFNQGM